MMYVKKSLPFIYIIISVPCVIGFSWPKHSAASSCFVIHSDFSSSAAPRSVSASSRQSTRYLYSACVPSVRFLNADRVRIKHNHGDLFNRICTPLSRLSGPTNLGDRLDRCGKLMCSSALS